jgi:D-sedoheptulose 7-phosphate isomerase
VESFFLKYIDRFKNCLDEIGVDKLVDITEVLWNAYTENRQVFIMGNGGSAATASHFACDLGKGTIVEGRLRFRVMSLNDNMGLITALSNDFGYEEVFKEQLINLVNQGDVVIAITASGNSPNVLKAIEYAKSKGALTIGFIGSGGGKLKEIVDKDITISNRNYGQVENIHLILEHLITEYLKGRIESRNSITTVTDKNRSSIKSYAGRNKYLF